MFDGFSIAINISSSQLTDHALAQLLQKALDRTGMAASRLEWEVKESTVLQNNTAASSMLDHIARMKIPLTIGDFGTGYSSLSYLRRHSEQKIKIDHSLIQRLSSHREHRAITEAIISMAHPLGLSVAAEGVETPQQIEYLRAHGCDSRKAIISPTH